MYIYTDVRNAGYKWAWKYNIGQYPLLLRSSLKNKSNHGASLLISDQQMIQFSPGSNEYTDSKYFSKDLFFSVLDSITIKKVK